MANYKNQKTFIRKKISQIKKQLNYLKQLKLSKEVVQEIKRHLDVKSRTLNRQMNMKINKK